jgi:hypothetical protein
MRMSYLGWERQELCTYNILVGNLRKDRHFGRQTRRWKNNIKADLREIGCEDRSGWNWLRIVSTGGFWN